MSLERAALRLATVMALTNGYAAPWPTMAQNRVFDSRQDQIQGIEVGQVVPMVIVYTDDDIGHAISNNQDGPPFDHETHLILEITLGQATEYKADDESDPVLVLIPPQSEPELEASIDAFEAQIYRVFRDKAGPWGAQLDAVINRIKSWESKRFVDHETSIRLVSRQITLAVRLVQPEDPRIGSGDPYIPEPYNSLLQAIIDGDGPHAPTATLIQEQLLGNAGATPFNLPQLDRIRFIEANQARKNEAGDAAGPRADGVAEIDYST
ncbi:hypothetical protein Hden_1225 [Hyphomicrobium denitrificans ATCC 51888]|uniref:Uncharacterized protein n=1 Tax=Hyphomicrobium denitrificans (strain ATCC 51888 / DSM 1869 / NCIMB 11706 / TK 0415) TaxID=582899 RepID=D8JWC4_HYPDA|nr:hypothetical protein [Hyphomicrobium denitrificans]ADJ23037.1 hypothetical protein Hden_1225 [Hyphomicrobium denitrificans ATCC 51888]